MAKQIKDLTNKTSLVDTDQFALDDTLNKTWKITANKFKNYIAAGLLVKMFQAIDTTGGMTITNISQVLALNSETIKDDYYSHSTTVNPGEVTILHSGWYRVSAMTTIQSVDTSGGTRGNPHLSIEIDSGSGFVVQPDKMGGYVRENADSLAASLTGIGFFNFNANDKIRLAVYDSVTAEPNEETKPYSSRLLIEYIDRTGSASGTVDNLKDVGDVNAPAPSDGQILEFDSATSKWILGNKNTSLNDESYSKVDGESSTTSSSYQDKVSMNFTPDSVGNYYLSWYCEVVTGSAYQVAVTEIDMDSGTSHPGYSWNEPVESYSNGGWVSISGMQRLDALTKVSHTFKIKFKSGYSGDTTYIRRARLHIWREL